MTILFQTIDQDGVGELIKIGTERGRKTKPHLKVGICGEHGGDPESVKFHLAGMNYVSCSLRSALSPGWPRPVGCDPVW